MSTSATAAHRIVTRWEILPFKIQNIKYKIPNVKRNILKFAEKQNYLILVICEKNLHQLVNCYYLVENIRLIFLKIFAMNDM